MKPYFIIYKGTIMEQENSKENKLNNEKLDAIESDAMTEEAPSTVSTPGHSEVTTSTQINKSKFKFDKGIITLFALFAVILVGYGGYNLYQKYSRNTVEFNEIHFTVPKGSYSYVRKWNDSKGGIPHEYYEYKGIYKDGQQFTIKIGASFCKSANQADFKNVIKQAYSIYVPDGCDVDESYLKFDNTQDIWSKKIHCPVYGTSDYVGQYLMYDKATGKFVMLSVVAPVSLSEEVDKIVDSIEYKPESK